MPRQCSWITFCPTHIVQPWSCQILSLPVTVFHPCTHMSIRRDHLHHCCIYPSILSTSWKYTYAFIKTSKQCLLFLSKNQMKPTDNENSGTKTTLRHNDMDNWYTSIIRHFHDDERLNSETYSIYNPGLVCRLWFCRRHNTCCADDHHQPQLIVQKNAHYFAACKFT